MPKFSLKTLAVFLVALVLVGWFFFVDKPEKEILTNKIEKVSKYVPSIPKVPIQQKITVKKVANTQVRKPDQVQPNLDIVEDCINEKIPNQTESLKKYAELMNWNKGKTLKQNLIYQQGNTEKRINLIPTESEKAWQVKIFNVDTEGLPIYLDEDQVADFATAKTHFDDKVRNFDLISEEDLIEVNNKNIRGKILFINGNPEEISLFNVEQKYMLECLDGICNCNKNI